jgi:hypothetical protein
MANLRDVIQVEAFQKAHAMGMPMLVCGDFNVPSHHDWKTPNK